MSARAEALRLALRLLKQLQRGRQLPIETVRRRLQRLERVVPGPPVGTRTEVIDVDGVKAVRITTAQARDDTCILQCHGGGYMVGTAPLYRDFTWRIGAASRAWVLYFDYRLAPEHPFPAALDDALAAYLWLGDNTQGARRLFVMGDSAGGGLALSLLLKLRDEGRLLPVGAVALSPWTDLALTGLSLRENAAADPMLNADSLPAVAQYYLARADPRTPYASPLYGDTEGLPPVLIQVGSDEILRDDAVRMAEKLRRHNPQSRLEIWPRMPHAWQLFAPVLPEARRAIAGIGEFASQLPW